MISPFEVSYVAYLGVANNSGAHGVKEQTCCVTTNGTRELQEDG